MKNDFQFLENNPIQGLYGSDNFCECFWTLKAKVDLSFFQKRKPEGEKQ
ncbi:MAG: hypothetical protein JW702_08015 [Clostridiales bacterium]|nr:hypothetical protein [Clostridiales bacterium]